jgi:hypothetical protein
VQTRPSAAQLSVVYIYISPGAEHAGYCFPDKTRFSLGPCLEETHPGAAQYSVGKTSPGEAKAIPSAAQASVVETSTRAAQALLSRHVHFQLRPLCCDVDTSRSSTDLSSVDTSICSSDPCGVDTSIGAAHAGYLCPDTSRCSLGPCTVV